LPRPTWRRPGGGVGGSDSDSDGRKRAGKSRNEKATKMVHEGVKNRTENEGVLEQRGKD